MWATAVVISPRIDLQRARRPVSRRPRHARRPRTRHGDLRGGRDVAPSLRVSSVRRRIRRALCGRIEAVSRCGRARRRHRRGSDHLPGHLRPLHRLELTHLGGVRRGFRSDEVCDPLHSSCVRGAPELAPRRHRPRASSSRLHGVGLSYVPGSAHRRRGYGIEKTTSDFSPHRRFAVHSVAHNHVHRTDFPEPRDTSRRFPN